MYYPFFRGKQFELITVRETASLMAESNFVPIIAPVREQFRSLHKALGSICEAGGQAVVIINPEHGELSANGAPISELLNAEFDGHDNLMVGIRLHADLSASEAFELCEKANGRSIILIHAGFKAASEFAARMNEFQNITTSAFLAKDCGKLYQQKFQMHPELILIRDGFERRRNRDHPNTEFFSDLHITYRLEGMTGFGDFLIVGDDYIEGGGPAYTVAIHLTYIDPDQDEAMFVHHFLSDSRETPKDPAGKFAEALAKLIAVVNEPDSKIYETAAIQEFRDLHERGHYPGLGSLKKLSMKHHIETLAHFLSTRQQGAE